MQSGSRNRIVFLWFLISVLLKKAIKYLLYNCFFKFGSKIFQQVIGIPTRSDPVPVMADHFLFYYEEKWIRNTKRENLIQARKLSNMFRFIDDPTVIIDGGEFDEIDKI